MKGCCGMITTISYMSIGKLATYYYSISAIPLGTCEKAKACEYRES